MSIPEAGTRSRLLAFIQKYLRKVDLLDFAYVSNLTVADLAVPARVDPGQQGVIAPVDFEQVGGLVIGETYLDAGLPGPWSWTLSSAPSTAAEWHPAANNDGYSVCKVEFVVPQSGQVRIRVQVTIDVSNANTILFALCTALNGTFLGNQYQKRVLLTGTASNSAADSVTHVEWLVDGLTPGTSTTYYLGAAIRSGTAYLKWGGAGGGVADTTTASYPPFIMEAIAVASNAEIMS